MLEQIDKDVRRTLPDFAFFQLPIPYSSLCPLSIEPKRRKPKKLATAKDPTIGTVNGTRTSPTIVSSGSTGSLPGSGFVQRQRTIHGSSMDLKRSSITRTLTPTLKRRQTVTVMSPMAEKKKRGFEDTDHWQSTAFSSSSVDSGTETPPLSLSNGFRTPNNYSSPVPSRLRGMAKVLPNVDSDDPEDEEDEEESTAIPDYLFSPIPTRRSLFKRVAHLNQDFGSRQHQPHSLLAFRSKDSWTKKRHNQGGSRQKQDYPSSTSPESMSESDNSCHDELPQDLHWEAIERILFIYAKLNPGVGYVQGMNEILGPLYYLLANDPDEVSRAHAEAESFWLFHLLMAHFRDHFVRSLDRDRTSGIGSTIARMNFRLRQFDEHLWQNLEDKAIAPEYYSFRWLTVLCTQEFEVPDVWRIWDSVLADTGGVEKDYDFLLDFGCAMVCHLRIDLLEGDFADNVKLLQVIVRKIVYSLYVMI
ncbi:rab-GTPase-TBC domain-containing protein [Dissophora ornata]|nr:rab-GTPase-TBC domain-containing protein [Dissophora ornata]